MANINQEIDTIRVGGTDYEVSDPHALYGEHDESAPDLVDVPLYESDLVTQVTDDSTKPSAANVPYQLKQEINQISSDIAELQTSTLSGGYVDISGYTSSNKYTAPHDGYLWIYAPLNAVGTVAIESSGAYSGTFTHTCYNGVASAGFGNSLFVKKGMKLYVTSNTNATIRFFPLM